MLVAPWNNCFSFSISSLISNFIKSLYFYSCYAINLKDRASEIYKRVEDQKSSRGRNQDALLAACLYIACRQEDKPRTVKGTSYDFLNIDASRSIIPCINKRPWTDGFQIEICSVANGATKKEIGRAKEYIVKQLGLENGQSVEMGTIHAGDFMVSVLHWCVLLQHNLIF